MSRPLTPDEIDRLAKDVTRAKMLHPGYRGAGDGITIEWPGAKLAEPLTVGSRRNVYDLTVRVSVNAEAAGRLPGFPGTMEGDEVDPPITGLDLLLGEAQHAAQEAVDRVIMASPLAADARVGPGPEGGVIFVRIAYFDHEDRAF